MFPSVDDSPGLSVIAIFFNMRREAKRTLLSLSRSYQHLSETVPLEILVIDNGSSLPLDRRMVDACGPEFSYTFVEPKYPSPCSAINDAVERARFDNVMILIDGARILSPGVLHLTVLALAAFRHPFVYTLGMHLGRKPQNYSITEGYDQLIEDALLGSVDWPANGYSLFSISSPALSSKSGFFSEIAESNCFALRKADFVQIGLYQTAFTGPGGGLCNLEVFNRINCCPSIEPLMLLGEASFHQFHGGVATNVPLDRHPWKTMAAEYAKIVGEPYRTKFRTPLYLGPFREECRYLYQGSLIDPV